MGGFATPVQVLTEGWAGLPPLPSDGQGERTLARPDMSNQGLVCLSTARCGAPAGIHWLLEIAAKHSRAHVLPQLASDEADDQIYTGLSSLGQRRSQGSVGPRQIE